MTEGINRLHSAAYWLDRPGGKLNNSWFSRWIGVGSPTDHFVDSAAAILKGDQQAKGKISWALHKLVPPPFRAPLGRTISWLAQMPGVRQLSGFMKGNIVIGALFGMVGALYDTVQGYRKTQGDVFDRFGSAITSGFKSVLKTAGDLGIQTIVALAVPTMLGVSAVRGLGIASGFVASLVASIFTQKGLDSVLNIQGHTPEAIQNRLDDMPVPQSAQDVVANIDRSFKGIHTQVSQGVNPFVTGMPAAQETHAPMTF